MITMSIYNIILELALWVLNTELNVLPDIFSGVTDVKEKSVHTFSPPSTQMKRMS